MSTRKFSADSPDTGTAAGPTMNFATHLKRTVRLAGPMIVMRAGLLIMVAVDTAMIGHYGTLNLAYYAAGNALQVVMVLVTVGLLQGTMVLVAQAHGAGAEQECGSYWRVGLVHGVVLGLAMAGICFLGEIILVAVGQSAELASGGAAVLRMISWGLPALGMWVATSFFLDGLSRPLPSMVLTLLAIFFNAGLNAIFIYGALGAPEMGAEGAALATSITRWVMFAALVLYVLKLPDRAALGIGGAIRNFWLIARKLRRIGIPMGAARGLEAAAFSALTMLAGLLGTVPLAGYQIAFNLVALVFMCAIGVAGAGTIRVGNAVGRHNSADIRYAGWSALTLITIIMAFFTVLFFALGTSLAELYTDDPAVIFVAVPLIFIAGIVLIFDGGQAVLMGALRGMADVWLPPVMQFVSWWGVAVPVAYVLAFHAGLGTPGLMWGFLAGALVSCTSLALRFTLVSRRAIQRY
ncbi:MAG: MATE family efflux transporter [Rhodospirillaceae bacterium]|nr:MATE family efflux transporter [Rhodospirillaceae bacterium]